MTRGASDPDPDFLEFVHARQHTLLRAAFLLGGDPDLAERALLEALTALAREWESAREERPDAVVRTVLYRDVLSSVRRRGRGADGAVDDADRDVEAVDGASRKGRDHRDDEEEQRRREVMVALDSLTPAQRAVLVLRVYDERTTHDVAEILGVRAGVVEEAMAAGLTAETLLSREALELASEQVIETELAESAWARAVLARRTVRRRSVLAVAGLGAAGVVVAVVRRDGAHSAPRVAPSPTTSPTVGRDGSLPFLGVGGIRVSLAPEAVFEPDLPRYPDADSLALPARLTTGEDRPRTVLDPNGIAGVEGSVRAVFLVHADGGGYEPLVFIPAEVPAHLTVPGVRLGGSGAASGDRVPVLGPRTIAEDRHRLVFVQPAALIILDTRDASTRWIEVPDPSLLSAGWARDGETVIARGATDSWVIGSTTEKVRRAEGPVGAEWVDLVDLGSRSLLRSFSGAGALTDTREMRGPGLSPTSPPVANTEGWVAVGASLPPDISRAMSRDHGIVVVQSDLRPTPRILAAAQGPSRGARPYRAVAWGPRDVALMESLSIDQADGSTLRRLLAWDVIGGALWLASELEPESPDVGGFTGSWAI